MSKFLTFYEIFQTSKSILDLFHWKSKIIEIKNEMQMYFRQFKVQNLLFIKQL